MAWHKASVLTRLILPLLVFSANGCGSQGVATGPKEAIAQGAEAPSLGWSYLPDRPLVIYRFGDAADAEFVGLCNGRPMFMLMGGDYPLSSSLFEIVIEGRAWALEAAQHQHGRHLAVEESEAVDGIANATRPITFKVGTWSRSIEPNPLLRRFVRECRSAIQSGRSF